jgi:hypothetical protein
VQNTLFPEMIEVIFENGLNDAGLHQNPSIIVFIAKLLSFWLSQLQNIGKGSVQIFLLLIFTSSTICFGAILLLCFPKALLSFVNVLDMLQAGLKSQ